jgi:hypothetical protein
MAETVGLKETGTQPLAEALSLHSRASQILVRSSHASAGGTRG